MHSANDEKSSSRGFRRCAGFTRWVILGAILAHTITGPADGDSTPGPADGDVKTPTGAKPAPAMSVEFQRLTLREVDPLRGGRILHLSGDGNAVLRLIVPRRPQPGLFEKRVTVQVPPELMRRMFEAIRDRHFFELMLPVRAGLPGGMRCTITAVSSSGATHEVGKWFHDSNEDFDAVRRACVAAFDEQTRGKEIFDGAFDPGWRPQ